MLPKPAMDFELNSLKTWLSQHIEGVDYAHGPLTLEKIGEGQSNPTFFVNAGARRLVLRKQPPGELLPSAHAIDREYRIMGALAATNVPVPTMIAYCEDKSVIGTAFYVMERIDGAVMANYALPEIAAPQRQGYYDAAAKTLAQLHSVDLEKTQLADYGKPGNYFARQIARWTRQWQASKTGENADVEMLVAWLPEHIPSSEITSIAHGDFRFGNLMFARIGGKSSETAPQVLPIADPRGAPQRGDRGTAVGEHTCAENGGVRLTAPQVLAVLDWELSTLGHPLADLAFFCMAWHMPPSAFEGLRGLDLAALGVPTQAEFVARYQAEGGCREPLLPFHLAFSMFRFAVILEGVKARGLAGNASASNAANVGALGQEFARAAVGLIGSSPPKLGGQ
jgi:aminoglycoside phosphotransferase (APT) family kinase protein